MAVEMQFLALNGCLTGGHPLFLATGILEKL